MYDGVSLRDFLSLIQQNDEVLLEGFPYIDPGFLNGKTVAEAAWQRRAVGQIPLILRFLLDDDLKVVKSHAMHCTLCALNTVSSGEFIEAMSSCEWRVAIYGLQFNETQPLPVAKA